MKESIRQRVFLITEMSRREVVGRYRGSAMGLLWSFFSPLLMLAVYTFVFSVVFKVRWSAGDATNANFAMNLFVGVIVHGFFAECLNRAPGLVAANVNYVKKVAFPLWVLPTVVVIAALFHLIVSFAVLLACFAIYYGTLPLTALLAPLVIVPLIVMVLGFSWFFSALGVYLRDLGQVMPVVTMVMLFLAPVFFPIDSLPDQFHPIVYLNPLTYGITTLRGLLLDGKVLDLVPLATFSGISLAIALLGWAFFRRVRTGFADVL